MKSLSVTDLYDNLKKTIKEQLCVMSFTPGKTQVYIADTDTGKVEKTMLFSELEDLTFINTLRAGSTSSYSLKQYMAKKKFREKNADAEVVFLYGGKSGVEQLFVVHNTYLGPAIGGLREFDYPAAHGAVSIDAMVTDCLRLAEGMTKKAAINKTESGGGKAARSVRWLTTEDKQEPELVEAHNQKRAYANQELAHALNIINKGRLERGAQPYYTAEDVGTTCLDFDAMAEITPYAISRSLKKGGSGNPSPYTALGLIHSMIEGARRRFKIHKSPLKDRTILLQGIGNCGREVLKHLIHYEARVIATDIHQSAIDRAKKELGHLYAKNVEFVFYDEEERKENKHRFFKEYEADIYSPCALGGTINQETFRLLNYNGVKLIAGTANNQLGDARESELLHHVGILYLPDYVVNGGGLINARHELPDRLHRMDEVARLAINIGGTIADILDLSYLGEETLSGRKTLPPLESVEKIVRARLSES